MSINKKFEEMLERLINEDREGAAELFHDIVVERSREIYQGLLESEFEEDFDLDTFEVEGEDGEDDLGGDATDDFIDDVETDMDDEDMSDDEDGDVDDRIEDLEDAFEQLKAEFEELLNKDDMDDEDSDMDMDDEDSDMGDDGSDMDMDMDMDDEDSDMDDEDDMPVKKSASEQMREYVEKIGGDSYEKFAKGGDNGVQTKSTVASKNDMGGTAKNLNQGGAADTKGTNGGLEKNTPSDMKTGNVNVPGGKASKSVKPMPKGHGTEKKGAAEQAANKKSTIGSK